MDSAKLTEDGAAVLCDLMLLELWNGASGAEEARMLRDLEPELESVPTSDEVWRTARAMARACRRKSVSVPATDLLIAACAERHGLGLLHHDAHFDRITAATAPGRK
jgi:predicted nucleic acid-binding protein